MRGVTGASRYAVRLLMVAALAQPALARAQGASVALDSATVAAIAPIVAEARAKQLPVDLLYVKAREGQVMHAPRTAVTAAVRALTIGRSVRVDAVSTRPAYRPGTVLFRTGSAGTGQKSTITPSARFISQLLP